MSYCLPACSTFLHEDTLKHSWSFTPPLYAKEQMLCNILFSIETIASTPIFTRPLSPALHEWSLAGKNVSGPPCFSLPQCRLSTRATHSALKHALESFSSSYFTLCGCKWNKMCYLDSTPTMVGVFFWSAFSSQSTSLCNRWPLYSMYRVWFCALTPLFMCMTNSPLGFVKIHSILVPRRGYSNRGYHHSSQQFGNVF